MNDTRDNKKTIAEIERISNEYWKNINELKREQNAVVREYVLKLDEKKREEIRKKLV